MTFWQLVNNNWTKILGSLTAALGALQIMISTGVLDKLVSDVTRGWLGVVVGLVTAAVGFNNSSKEKVAAAMETAIEATPGSTLPKEVTDMTIKPKEDKTP